MKRTGKKLTAMLAVLAAIIAALCMNVSAANVIESNMKYNCEPYDTLHCGYEDIAMGGYTFKDAMKFRMGYTGLSNGHVGRVSFNLVGSYNEISFYVGAISGERANQTFTVTLDGEVLVNDVLLRNDIPRFYTLDVEGGYQLTIEFTPSGYSYYDPVYYGIGGLTFVSDGKVRDILLESETLSLSTANPSAYLKAHIVPADADNQTIVWSSSNNNIAVVNSKGLVTGKSGGTAVITAKAANGSTAQCTVNVDMPKSIATASVKLTANKMICTGNQNKPGVIVKDGDRVLEYGRDYTIEYKNNIKVGRASATVVGTGEYGGSKTLYFNILPGKTSKLTVSQTSSSIKLTWKAVPGAKAYRVSMYDTKTKKYKTLKDTTATSYTVKKLKSGTEYKFTVKAYASVNGATYWSDSYKAVTTATKPGTPTLKVSAGSKKAVLSWDKQTGATGYVVYMATSKNGSYKKISMLKGNTKVKYTKTGLTKGKTYYFKVAAYKTAGGSNVYSTYSAVKSVKVK